MPYKYINKLQGKRVLVFGGTSGIGFGVVEACLEHGAIVCITGSNPAKLEKTVQRLKEAYPEIKDPQIITHPCDLADAKSQEANIKALLEAVTDGRRHKLDHVAFTAGDALIRTPISEFDAEAFNKGSLVRRVGPMNLAKHLPKYIQMSPDSSLTLTSGVNVTKPAPGWAVVVAGAASTEGLTRGLAVDLAPLRVNVVSPGAIMTELLEKLHENVLDMYKHGTTVKRLGRPEDIAESYLACMKDGFLTGTKIDSSGGRLLV